MVSYLFIQTPLFEKFGFIVAIVVVHNQHMPIYYWEIEYKIRQSYRYLNFSQDNACQGAKRDGYPMVETISSDLSSTRRVFLCKLRIYMCNDSSIHL